MFLDKFFSLLQIRSMRGVIVYAASIGIIAIAAVLGSLQWLGGADVDPSIHRLGFIVSAALGLTLGFFGGVRNLHIWRLSEELTRLVNRDRLTDVATRDYFFSKMGDNPEAYGVSLMVDIDHFKQVNDTHGHLAGDRVITHVAQTLRSCVRSNDIVARFGGEEFVIFLVDHDREVGYAVAERMRSRIESEVCQIDGTNLPVTVSIGGSLKEAVDHIERSIKDADEALYRAKSLGRNRTVFGRTDKQFARSA